jgi:hypothetical protein
LREKIIGGRSSISRGGSSRVLSADARDGAKELVFGGKMARLVANLAGPGALMDDADCPSPAVDNLAEFETFCIIC